MNQPDLSQLSMLDLFRLDAESQVQTLTDGLLALERDGNAAGQLEICMRAAHSLKGAARIVGLDAGVRVTHAMEDCFVAAQRGAITLQQAQIDVLLRGVDLVNRISKTPETEIPRWSGDRQAEISAFLAALSSVLETPPAAVEALLTESPPPVATAQATQPTAQPAVQPPVQPA